MKRVSSLKDVTPDLRPVDEIRFVDLKRVNPRAAEVVMETRTGQPIDQTTLDRDMNRLYGMGDFEHVSYRFLEELGRRVLAVDAVEKSWGPNYLRFGLGLSTDFSGDAYFNLLASYRKTWMNSLGGEWRSDFQIGRTSSLKTEFYQPLDSRGYFFVAPHAGVEQFISDVYEGDHRVARYQATSLRGGIDVGTHMLRYGELRLGLLRGVVRPKLDTGPLVLSPDDSPVSVGGYRLRLIHDQLDSVHFPRSGWGSSAQVFASRTGLGADTNYTRWDVDGSSAYSFGDHTFNFGFKMGGKAGSGALPRYDMFQWGGFLQQSGYATGQLLGDNTKFGRLMYYRRVLQGSMLEGAYLGLSFEVGKVGNPLFSVNPTGTLMSGAVLLAADTPIGPAYLGYGRARDGNSSLYFYLGRPF